uniref:Uncharacterized protein n=1 Tax=Arundo donax TaxID=35708 RepID=A0A0A9H9G5_ARUDO
MAPVSRFGSAFLLSRHLYPPVQEYLMPLCGVDAPRWCRCRGYFLPKPTT